MDCPSVSAETCKSMNALKSPQLFSHPQTHMIPWLLRLGRMRDCPWLMISIYSVSRDNRMRLHSIKKVFVNLLEPRLL